MIYPRSVYKLTSETTRKLLEMPESGMGYQMVSGLAGNPLGGHERRGNFFILNASFAELIVETTMDIKVRFSQSLNNLKSDDMSKDRFESLHIKNLKTIGLNGSFRYQHCSNVWLEKGRPGGGKAAVKSNPKNPNGIDPYVRLSAFENDKRVDREKGCLRPGSFTTMEPDYIKCFTSEDNPNDRYALPNENEIKFAFYFQPSIKDEVKEGIVQPDFGKCGGGEEAFFENGTSPKTFLDGIPYGKILNPTKKIPRTIDPFTRDWYGLPFGRPGIGWGDIIM